MCLPFCIFMMSWSLKLNWSGLLFCFCSSLPLWSTSTMSSIPQGTVFALLLALFLCGVHWVQCSSVQWSSHVGSVGSVSSVSLEAVWLDQVAVPDLWYQSPVVAATTVGCVSPLCSCPLLTLHVLCSFFCCSCFSDSRHSNPQADSEGFVMNGILLHIRRKCTLQCGFTNCLHCPKNDSLYAADNGRQTDRQTRPQSLQANHAGQTGRWFCDRYSHHRTGKMNFQ